MPPGVLIGVALNRATIEGREAIAGPIVAAQFDSVTPENVLKWGLVHPEPARYDFTAPDAFVALGEKPARLGGVLLLAGVILVQRSR